MKLLGKIALVTGGTRGIGAAAALALARDGADVAITGRNLDDESKEAENSIRALGRRAALIQADFADPKVGEAVVSATQKALGPIDILVHSAGGPANGGLLQITENQWHEAFNVHVHSIFHLARTVIPAMREKKEGAIVLISSTAGIRGIITNVAYQVAKGAIPQLTRALAREFADDNIRINCVAPGVVRTAFHKTMSEQQKKLNLEQRIPLHREGTPDQVASVIVELVKNDYMTGEMITIDGGLTMRIA